MNSQMLCLKNLNKCIFSEIINELPHACGVYIVVTDKSEVLYVGMSININQRWRSHHIAQEVKALGTSHIYYKPLPNEQLAI